MAQRQPRRQTRPRKATLISSILLPITEYYQYGVVSCLPLQLLGKTSKDSRVHSFSLDGTNVWPLFLSQFIRPPTNTTLQNASIVSPKIDCGLSSSNRPSLLQSQALLACLPCISCTFQAISPIRKPNGHMQISLAPSQIFTHAALARLRIHIWNIHLGNHAEIWNLQRSNL